MRLHVFGVTVFSPFYVSHIILYEYLIYLSVIAVSFTDCQTKVFKIENEVKISDNLCSSTTYSHGCQMAIAGF